MPPYHTLQALRLLQDIESRWLDPDGLAAEAARGRVPEDRKRQLRQLKAILEILKPDSKYEMCCLALSPCLRAGDPLHEANRACETSKCTACGFARLWSEGLRKQLFNRNYCEVSRKWTQKFRPGVDSEWAEEVFWSEYTSRPARERGKVLRDNEEADQDWKASVSNARETTLDTVEGTVCDFLDAFEECLANHIPHRVCHETSKRADRQFHHQRRPFMVCVNVDYSENGPIANSRKLQSDHWISKQFTLLIFVYDWLCVKTWNDKTSSLNVGDEVTVNGELAGSEIAPDSYFATIVRQVSPGMYDVEQPGHPISSRHLCVPRELLRHRVVKNVVCGGISDDRSHDRWQHQHFSEASLSWLEKHLKELHTLDMHPSGVILSLHIHSDNASSHFKSTGALEWFTRKGQRQAKVSNDGDRSFVFTWTFGCPGHGKGLWDGLGGMIKSKVKSLVRDYQSKKPPRNLPGINSVALRGASDVYNMMVAHFDTVSWREEAAARGKRIQRIKFFLSSKDPEISPVLRHHPEEFNPKLDGISSNYQHHMIERGLVDAREGQCW